MYRVMQWTHSVAHEADHVGSPLAQFLGLQLELEMVLSAQGHDLDNAWLDPRLRMQHEDPSCTAHAELYATSDAHLDTRMDSQCVHRSAFIAATAQEEPCMSDLHNLSEREATCTGYVVYRSELSPPRTSCLRTRLRRHLPLRVQFAFEVSFWFPLESQLSLSSVPAASHDSCLPCQSSLEGCIPRLSAIPFCSSLPNSGTGGLSGNDGSPGKTASRCHSFFDGTPSVNVIEPAIWRPIMNGQPHAAPSQQGFHLFETPSLIYTSTQDDDSPATQPRQIAGLSNCRPRHAARRGLAHCIDALRPGLQPVVDADFLGSHNSHYTSFDSIQQAVERVRHPDWTTQLCMGDAVFRSPLPEPIGRVLRHPVRGFKSPLIMVSQNGRRFSHRSVVFVCALAPAGFLVCDVPVTMSPQTFLLQATTDPRHPWAVFLQTWPTFECQVNGLPHDCFVALPAHADVVNIVPIHMQDLAFPRQEVALAPTNLPISQGRWSRRALKDPPHSPVSLNNGTEGLAVLEDVQMTEDPPEDSFAVFDVYFHARVLPSQHWHTTAHRVAIALENTPQIAREIAHFRVLTHLLPGFPRHQIVIWGDRLPTTVIVPVAFGEGVGAVCTVEAPGTYSGLQLTALACRSCGLPEYFVESVSELDSQVLINGEPVYPLDTGACQAADSASVQGNTLRPVLRPKIDHSQAASASSSDIPSSLDSFVRTLSPAAQSEGLFTISVEAHAPFLSFIPPGSSMADLVALAFKLFPALGPRCGHRVLQRPITGLPPIQICIWGTIGANDRVVQLVLDDASTPFALRRRTLQCKLRKQLQVRPLGIDSNNAEHTLLLMVNPVSPMKPSLHALVTYSGLRRARPLLE